MNRKTSVLSFTVLLFALIFLSQPVTGQIELSFPNELKGLEFYGKGKLDGIKLGITRSDDWDTVFGAGKDEDLDLNEDWRTSGFISVNEGALKTINEDGIERKYQVFPSFTRTLWQIILAPKKRISLRNYHFPDVFKISAGFTSHSACTFTIYGDEDGLSYSIVNANPKDKSCRAGELSTISYDIPDRLDSTIYFLVGENYVGK